MRIASTARTPHHANARLPPRRLGVLTTPATAAVDRGRQYPASHVLVTARRCRRRTTSHADAAGAHDPSVVVVVLVVVILADHKSMAATVDAIPMQPTTYAPRTNTAPLKSKTTEAIVRNMWRWCRHLLLLVLLRRHRPRTRVATRTRMSNRLADRSRAASRRPTKWTS